MRSILACVTLLCAALASAASLPATVEVTIEPQKFGDVASILKVDSTVASFNFDQPVSHLALVIETYPKEARAEHVARLALNLTKPVREGRFCLQMVDQGFLPLGNGAPHQMQLFMQLDCGGALVSSSQSFLKEKFNFSRSLARTGSGTLTRQVEGHRAPVLWLMGNSESGAYLNDDDLGKMIAKNRDAYVLVAYLEVAKEAPPVLESGGASGTQGKSGSPIAAPLLAALVGPPFPVPTAKVPEAKTSSSKTTTSTKKPAVKKTSSKTSSKKKSRSS